MNRETSIGTYIQSAIYGGESYRAFIPAPLPPKPPLKLDQLHTMLDKATSALGRLNGISQFLPNAELINSMLLKREAVLSSQIEGINCSLADLLVFESGGTPIVSLDDIEEVSCYVDATNYSLKRLNDLPLSLRLLKEIHQKLMSNSRSRNKQPGEFRSSQNWIGGSKPSNARFVPPTPEHLMSCLDQLEKFFHDESVQLPMLVKAALAHLQFETIHPFLDGNGRTGRLLIVLMLHNAEMLDAPVLCLSSFLKKHQSLYYEHLDSVRRTGNWELWIDFVLDGIADVANEGLNLATSVVKLFEKDRLTIEDGEWATSSMFNVFSLMQRYPILTSNRVTNLSGMSLPTALRTLSRLQKIGILHETTGKERNKRFVYKAYLDLINSGTEIQPY